MLYPVYGRGGGGGGGGGLGKCICTLAGWRCLGCRRCLLKRGGPGRGGGGGGLLTCKNADGSIDSFADAAFAKLKLKTTNATTIKNLVNFILIGLMLNLIQIT
jgi:hypothetical protein